jgi:hypothetical protein
VNLNSVRNGKTFISYARTFICVSVLDTKIFFISVDNKNESLSFSQTCKYFPHNKHNHCHHCIIKGNFLFSFFFRTVWEITINHRNVIPQAGSKSIFLKHKCM